jgi:nucleoside-diphosphate-sugar epimerase
MIFGDGASEQLPLLIRRAISAGESIYVDEGANRWANVFLADLAEVYALALAKAPPGSTYNIASGELTMREIAEAIGVLTGTPVRSATLGEAHAVLGERWVDVALASNSRVNSARARDELGWNPVGIQDRSARPRCRDDGMNPAESVSDGSWAPARERDRQSDKEAR